MKPDIFWNSWDKPFKIVYQALLFLFLCSIAAYVFSYVTGSSFVINWEIENYIDPIRTLYDSYRLGIFEFPININNYVISKGFVASELQVNTWPAYILLIWIGIFISIMLALITDLSRFWFIASVILLTILLIGLKLDYLQLFHSIDKIGLVIAFILYFPSLYFFHFVRKGIGFIPRLFTHLTATGIFGIIIYSFSGVNLPFLHLVNYGIYVPLILTILFTFMIGHEIVSGFLRVITSGAFVGEKNSLVHFLVISLVFLLNATLVLLRNSKILELDIYVIGSFWLLTIASVIGLWGYRVKEITYKGMFSFYPIGAFLFLCLAITAHLTISYFFITGNDSFVEAIEDVIIYSQLGYSSMFIIYVIANFFDLIKHNVDVGKVLYQPRRMPYFISRFAGVIVIMGLFFRLNMTPYYQSVAGFYSGIGDLYLTASDYLSATEYYKLSNIFSGTSHRANYAMATMEKRNGNTVQEIEFLKQAVGKNPTEFSYATLGSRYLDLQRYFEAVFTLQDGLERFPDNGMLLNNLGLAYLQMKNVDSAFYYLESAQHHRKSANESTTNIYALLSKEDLSIKQDTLDLLLKKEKYVAASNNLVVLANNLKWRANNPIGIGFGNPDKTTIDQVIFNYNKTINTPSLVDSSYLHEMRIFYDSSNTAWFQDNVHLAAALALYRQGMMSKSFELLNHLAIQNPEGEYFSILGKLALLMGADGLAIDYFKSAFQNGHLEIAPELAFAYMENGELDKAKFIWEQIQMNSDSENAGLASKMIQVIGANDVASMIDSDIETRFSFLAYRYHEFNLEKLEGLVLTFENEDLQAMGFLRLFKAYLELGQHQKAYNILQEIGRINISRKDVLDEINLAQCQYAYYVNDSEIMQRLYSNLKSEHILVNSYLELFRYKDETITMGKEKTRINFEHLGRNNPFFEPGVLESARYFNNEIGDPDLAYDILLNAVKLNPFSLELNKAYALQCLEVGLKSYALDAREELRSMMSSVIFRTFEQEFNAKMDEIESKSSVW